MKKWVYILILSSISCHAAKIFVRNWSTNPIVISQVSIPENGTANILPANIRIQPGQSVKLTHNERKDAEDNFDHITMQFTTNDYTKSEQIFMPSDNKAEVSLTFSDSGYQRYPYNILPRKIG